MASRSFESDVNADNETAPDIDNEIDGGAPDDAPAIKLRAQIDVGDRRIDLKLVAWTTRILVAFAKNFPTFKMRRLLTVVGPETLSKRIIGLEKVTELPQCGFLLDECYLLGKQFLQLLRKEN